MRVTSIGKVSVVVEVLVSSAGSVQGMVRFSTSVEGFLAPEPETVSFEYRQGRMLVRLPRDWSRGTEPAIRAVAAEIGLKIADVLRADNLIPQHQGMELQIGFAVI